jgi:(1->4)-alpha-D-glucan 1-alpha-D-glucosylmutase
MVELREPAATYRLQLHQGFGFLEARSLLPYLRDLGITHLYASPLFKARRGSLHGYSVTNPLELNPELGSKAAFDHLAHKLKTHGMGLILDIVPNHMAMSGSNPWWMDVLENGAASPYSVFFDIDWLPPKRTLEGRVLLPMLGKPFGQALEDQELTLKLDRDGLAVHYFDHKFPVAPKSYRDILAHRLEELEAEIGAGNPAFLGLTGLIALADHLPPRTATSYKKLKERLRDKEILKERVWLLYQGSPEIKKFLDENIEIFNGKKGDLRSFELLDNLLAHQPYRLAHWRVSLEIINYRRFFSINELIGIRVEDPQVFQATHALLFKLVGEGKIAGIRVDHIDGLGDPLEYLLRLKERLTPRDRTSVGYPGFPIFVEKILAQDEPLPQDWPICGTTGYDFLNMANGLFVDEQGFEELQGLFVRLTGLEGDFSDIVYAQKKMIMESLFGGEVESLGHELSALAEQDRHAQDISYQDLVQTLVEVIACLPIYRTYIREFEVPTRECQYLEEAIEEAMWRNPAPGSPAYDFIRRVLLLKFHPSFSEEKQENWLRFVRRWQQYTGAIMAKGLEDTALYLYNCLTSLNEVGSDCQPVTVQEFHQFNQERRAHWPCTLNATSTHDTKRSEDVRARLNVLSEFPRKWEERLGRWRRLNRGKKALVDQAPVPNPNEESHLYQTMLGAWPLVAAELPSFKERLKAYLVKAAREAKVNTRWIAPHPAYEKALVDFIEAILEPSPANRFLEDFRALQQEVAYWGALNSLSQLVLKIASPGVPDFYQGSELWDLSLVDPDNRRPVDFQKRLNFLKELRRAESKGLDTLAQNLLSGWQDGRLKLFLTYRGLNFRRRHLDLFLEGDYLPLMAAGVRKEHLAAGTRCRGDEWVLAVAPRFFSKLAPTGTPPLGRKAWGEDLLLLPPESPAVWEDIFTGESLTLARVAQGRALALKEVFRHLPVALLAGTAAGKEPA